jgi:hypothetical protein
VTVKFKKTEKNVRAISSGRTQIVKAVTIALSLKDWFVANTPNRMLVDRIISEVSNPLEVQNKKDAVKQSVNEGKILVQPDAFGRNVCTIQTKVNNVKIPKPWDNSEEYISRSRLKYACIVSRNSHKGEVKPSTNSPGLYTRPSPLIKFRA